MYWDAKNFKTLGFSIERYIHIFDESIAYIFCCFHILVGLFNILPLIVGNQITKCDISHITR